jgi:hypothetical protein
MMKKDELSNLYFEWMYNLVCRKQNKRTSYRKLLYFLHDTDFLYSIPLDVNRYEDGKDLRYRFCYMNDLDLSLITNYIDDRPCSILEMLIALSIRLEEHIMNDPEIGDRTNKWFWGMIDNLGLKNMTDENFDKKYTKFVICRFLNRDYESDGKGGLFTIENCKEDLREVEIWYQACWYLDTVL